MNSDASLNSKALYKSFTIHIQFPEEQGSLPILEANQLIECTNGDIKIGQWLLVNFSRIYSSRYSFSMVIQRNIFGNACDDISDILTTPSLQDLNTLFSIYSTSEDMYVYIGKYNQDIRNVVCKMCDIESSKILIKCRRPDKQTIVTSSKLYQSHCRTKERLIGSIINKVNEWRQLYKFGKPQLDNTIHRYSLEEAAQEVGVSKKSLDDYLLQLRFGREHGFDFNKYKNEKVGMLRKFVKDTKKNEAQKNKEAPGKIFDVIECKH